MTGLPLPAPLAPWASLLGLFPEDVAQSLGPMVERLAIAIGPFRRGGMAGHAEPDGVDGLARRGSYERLLASEWAVADAFPEEFLRRAASGEHVFLRTARKEPAASRRTVVLFDAGPAQLGTPRIAHVALLIVLARRAEAAGARFAWRVLQDPEAPLVTDEPRSSVQRLLQSRSSFGPAPIPFDEHRGDDLWVVSPSAIGGTRASRVEVRDDLTPGARSLGVVVRPASGGARETVLALPEDRACARILRDPFAAAYQAPTATNRAPKSNLLFVASGTKVLARGRNGRLIAYPVPNSPRGGVGRPKMYRPSIGDRPLAAGWGGHGPMMLMVVGASLVFEAVRPLAGMGDQRKLSISLAGEAHPEPTHEATPLSPLAPCSSQGRVGFPMFFMAGDGGVWWLGRAEDGQLHARRLAEQATGLARFDAEGVEFVGRGLEWTGASGWHRAMWDARGTGTAEPLEGDGTFEVFFGDVPAGCRGAERRVCAIHTRTNLWTLYTGERTRQLAPPPGARVVGLVTPLAASARPELVIVDGDGRALALLGAGIRRIVRAPAPIVQATCEPSRGLVAYATERGDLFVAQTHDGCVLAHFVADERAT